jgi:hypothetical protein
MKRSRKVNTNDDASKVDIRIKKDNKTYAYVYKLGDDKIKVDVYIQEEIKLLAKVPFQNVRQRWNR